MWTYSWVCTHVHMCVQICAHECRSQKLRTRVFIYHSQTYYLTWGLSLNLENTRSATLIQWAPRMLLFLCLSRSGIAVCSAAMPDILHMCWGPELRSSCLYVKYFIDWAVLLASLCVHLLQSSLPPSFLSLFLSLFLLRCWGFDLGPWCSCKCPTEL